MVEEKIIFKPTFVTAFIYQSLHGPHPTSNTNTING